MKTTYMIATTVALLIWLPLAAHSSNYNSSEHAGLLHELQTDSNQYWLEEDVHIAYTVTNITGDPIVVGWSWCCSPLQLRIYGPEETILWADPNSCPDEACIDTLAAGGFYSRSAVWDMRDLPYGELVDPGTYRIRGHLKTFFPELAHDLSVYIDILDPATAIPDDADRTWSFIKALYQ